MDDNVSIVTDTPPEVPERGYGSDPITSLRAARKRCSKPDGWVSSDSRPLNLDSEVARKASCDSGQSSSLMSSRSSVETIKPPYPQKATPRETVTGSTGTETKTSGSHKISLESEFERNRRGASLALAGSDEMLGAIESIDIALQTVEEDSAPSIVDDEAKFITTVIINKDQA